MRILEYDVDLSTNEYLRKDCNQLEDLDIIINTYFKGTPKDFTNCTVSVDFCKADDTKTIIEEDCISIIKNIIKITLPTDCTRAYGEAKFQTLIKNSDGRVLYSFPLRINVIRGVLDESTGESNNLPSIVENIHNQIEQIKDTLVDGSKLIEDNKILIDKSKEIADQVKKDLEDIENHTVKEINNKIDVVTKATNNLGDTKNILYNGQFDDVGYDFWEYKLVLDMGASHVSDFGFKPHSSSYTLPQVIPYNNDTNWAYMYQKTASNKLATELSYYKEIELIENTNYTLSFHRVVSNCKVIYDISATDGTETVYLGTISNIFDYGSRMKRLLDYGDSSDESAYVDDVNTENLNWQQLIYKFNSSKYNKLVIKFRMLESYGEGLFALDGVKLENGSIATSYDFTTCRIEEIERDNGGDKHLRTQNNYLAISEEFEKERTTKQGTQKTETVKRAVMENKTGDIIYHPETDSKQVLIGNGNDTLDNFINTLFNRIFPIKKIIFTEDSTNPAYYYGGTWKPYGQGTVLMGVGSNDGRTFNLGEKVGEYTERHYHNAGDNLFAEIGAYDNDVTKMAYRTTTLKTDRTREYGIGGSTYDNSITEDRINHSTAVAGYTESTETSTLQPSLPVYIWKKISHNTFSRSPMFVFIDKCRMSATSYVKTKPLFNKLGIKGTLAIEFDYTEQGKNLTTSQILEFQNDNWDIIPTEFEQLTSSNIESRLSSMKSCLEKYKSNTKNILLYPNGKISSSLIPNVQKYFEYGLIKNSSNEYNQVPLSKNYNILYSEITSATNLNTYKSQIDNTIADNGLCIFNFFAESFTGSNQVGFKNLESIIEYIQSLGGEIVTISEALERVKYEG
jgi:hypothetical protein